MSSPPPKKGGALGTLEEHVLPCLLGRDPQHVLANHPDWRQAHVDRVTRMIERDRNHPAVIAWSLGNESADGPNLLAAYRAAKRLDNRRPVHYEN